MKKLEIIFGIIKIPLDFILIMVSWYISYYIRPYTDLIPGLTFHFDIDRLPTLEYYNYFVLFTSILLTLFLVISKEYSLKSTTKLSKTLLKLITITSIWIMTIIGIYFLILHKLFFSRIILAHTYLFVIIFLFTERLFLKHIQSWFLKKGYGRRSLIFIGTNKQTNNLYKIFSKDPHYKIIDPSINTLEEIPKKSTIDEIICNTSVIPDTKQEKIIEYCQEHHIGYTFIPSIKSLNYSDIDIEFVAGTPLITLSRTPLRGWGRVIKRSFDILGSVIGLTILFPLFIIVSIKIKLDSKGPILYKSKRVGLKKTFYMYKFRSMVSNAESLKKGLATQNERKGPLFKIKNDPRITKFGRLLRKTSIDELPQLINVFIGDLSLVGPRAHLPEEVAKYDKHHKQVLAIKPGITGLAQVNGRSDLDFEDEVKFDTYYITNWSIWLDIKIIIKTINVVFSGKGAD